MLPVTGGIKVARTRSMQHLKYFIVIFTGLLFAPCYSQERDSSQAQEVSHVFYITANTGLPEDNRAEMILQSISRASQKDPAATLLLVGNTVPPRGYPANEEGRQRVQEMIENQLFYPITNFHGKVIITPGSHEWNEGSPQTIDDLESFLQDNSKGRFWPSDGCPIEREDINKEVVLITIDSQWFLQNWDNHPEINSECDIKTREQFFMEFQDDIKDSHGKTVVVAIHHPMMSNNRFGFFDRISGFTSRSFENLKQQELRGRLETTASQYDDIIFVSGNHRNLQFLDNERNPQIISGAAASTTSAKAKNEDHFASRKNGYSRLTIYKDGSSKVEFFEVSPQGTTLLFSRNIERERARLEEVAVLPEERIGPGIRSSIYTPEETDKGEFHQWIWGETYREVYSKEIEAPVLYIDTLPGNLRPLKEGGGQQSRSLRFIADNEKEYTIRAMRKSPLRYVQSDLVKESFIGDFLENTFIERSITDFYTTSYPYAPFAISGLADALGIYHVSPEIFYIPKQESLGIHNEDHGDALYMMEPHVGDENKELESFGSPDDILSTMDLLLEIRENKNSYVDQSSYIKARLFDMLIGDWDRHEDQWRWSQFEQENGDKVYYPIPRDRDQAFSKYDGALIALLKLSVPGLRKMQSYQRNIKNLKWFNWSGYPLDKSFINTAGWEEWEEQAHFLQENLSDEVIEESFAALPPQVQDKNIEAIKDTLKYRRDHLQEIARSYYDHFSEFEVIIGTEENDHFEIIRKDNGETEITISSEGQEYFRNSYNSDKTDEIWIYGLGGEDLFTSEGDGTDLIKLKIIGGVDHDIYDFTNTRKLKIYDHKSRESTITDPSTNKWLVDSYEINSYDYTKRKYHENKILPYANFVPDAGFALGIRNIYTTYGLARNPFTTQHRLGANYYFATNGYEVNYSGEFAHIFYKWNFGLEGRYTSPNYTLTYFGTGNSTTYDPSAVERDFNRVKIQQWRAAPSLIWRNETGSSFYFKPMLESLQVIPEGDDYISLVFSPENDIFNRQLYGGAEINYNFYNKNNSSFPSLGMELNVTSGYKKNIDEHDNRFGYLEPSFSFDYPLISSGFAVIASKIGGEVIVGDNYEFYHAATLGGNDNLRGYRNHRFNGQRAFYHSTDLRSAFALLETRFIPFILGASLGFDYGRVWSDVEESDRWHTNYGGSLWINALYAVSGSVGLYHGGDGNRLTFTLNFKY